VTVVDPVTNVDESSKPTFTTYKVEVETNLPSFNSNKFSVRRRYNDFVWLRSHIKSQLDTRGKSITMPELPGNTISSFLGYGRFEPDFIEDRRTGLEAFIVSVVKHPWARFEKGLHSFLEDQSFECKS